MLMKILSSRRYRVVITVMALCLLISPVCFSVTWADALPKESVLPLGLANKAIQAALDTCTKDGYRVSVSVVDRDGVLRAMGRADGAGPHTVDSSRKKPIPLPAYGVARVSLPISLPTFPRFRRFVKSMVRCWCWVAGFLLKLEERWLVASGLVERQAPIWMMLARREVWMPSGQLPRCLQPSESPSMGGARDRHVAGCDGMQ